VLATAPDLSHLGEGLVGKGARGEGKSRRRGGRGNGLGWGAVTVEGGSNAAGAIGDAAVEGDGVGRAIWREVTTGGADSSAAAPAAGKSWSWS